MSADRDTERRGALLAEMLDLAVAVEVPNMLERSLDDRQAIMGGHPEVEAALRGEGPSTLAALIRTGEAFLYRRAPGESAAAFSAIARGVAAGACWPGGVRMFGRRYIATHPEAQAAGWYDQCEAGGRNAWPGDRS